MKENQRCPKCNFFITNGYCTKCGYYNNNDYLNKYNTPISDIEIFLKDNYKKLKYNENQLLIFILGPLYFSIFKFYILGFSLFAIEFITCFIFHNKLFFLGLGMYPIILFYCVNRFLYLLVANNFLLKLTQLKLKVIKRKKVNYKEFICNYKEINFFSIFITIIFVILFFNIFLQWYTSK